MSQEKLTEDFSRSSRAIFPVNEGQFAKKEGC